MACGKSLVTFLALFSTFHIAGEVFIYFNLFLVFFFFGSFCFSFLALWHLLVLERGAMPSSKMVLSVSPLFRLCQRYNCYLFPCWISVVFVFVKSGVQNDIASFIWGEHPFKNLCWLPWVLPNPLPPPHPPRHSGRLWQNESSVKSLWISPYQMTKRINHTVNNQLWRRWWMKLQHLQTVHIQAIPSTNRVFQKLWQV